jgi:hypothetical protein
MLRSDAREFTVAARRAFRSLRGLGYHLGPVEATDIGVVMTWLGVDRAVQVSWEKRDRYIDVRVVLLRDGRLSGELPIVYLPLTFMLTERSSAISLEWPSHTNPGLPAAIVLDPIAVSLMTYGREVLQGGFEDFERFARQQQGGMPGFDWWASLPPGALRGGDSAPRSGG